MGLFSSEIRTTVSSVSYNLAGDEDLRPDFLKSVILGTVLSGSSNGMGESIMSAARNGPGQRQQGFFRWARNNYDLGMPSARILNGRSVNLNQIYSALAPILAPNADQTLTVTHAVIDRGDADYWAEDWVRQNHPLIEPQQWHARYVNSTQKIQIYIETEPSVIEIDAPADLIWAQDDPTKRLLYAAYTVMTTADDADVQETVQTLYTYRMGSGNVVLDNLQPTGTELYEFFPAMPLRLNNVSISATGMEDYYDAVKTAFKKLTGSKVDNILEDLEDQNEIDEIDYAYVVQAVPLNVKDNQGKAYLFKFFETLIEGTPRDYRSLYSDITNDEMARQQSKEEWQSWIKANSKEAWYYRNVWLQAIEGYKPTSFPVVLPESLHILEFSSNDLPSFNWKISWQNMNKTEHAGNGKVFDGNTSRGKMKKGEYWFTSIDPIYYWVMESYVERGSTYYRRVRKSIPRMAMFHQHGEYLYSKIEIVSLNHTNNVYNGHTVSIKAAEALADAEDSSFLVPLHYPTLRSMGMIQSARFSTSTSYLVLNMYQENEIKWYQKGIFRFILVIISVALAFVFPPGGGAAFSAGVLGTNVAVGTFLGASAASAAIVGAIANAIAGVIVSTIIQKASAKLFGGKLGAIIGALISFVALTVATNFATTGSLSVDWGSMMRADNLLKITNSVSDSYTRWLNTDTQDIIQSLTEIEQNYEKELEKISDLTDEILGMTNPYIDPIMFTDAAEYFGESSESFLSRTLLTGSDLAELSHAMISDFAELSLELPMAVS